jgi:predicted SprT family Zn-dependent metalloprotease
MTLQKAQTIWLNKNTQYNWVKYYCQKFPELKKFTAPTIELNNRFTKTAGVCYQEENRIQLAAKFFIKFEAEMLNTILKHEIAHQIDFNLFGRSEKKCGHGKKWCEIMVELGLPADKYHSLEL